VADRNRTRLTYPDATYVTYDYDQLNRLTAVRNSAGTALASYTYDVRSRRTGLEYTNGASIDYSYDAASRLLLIDNQTNNGQHKYSYTYDYVGNRMTMAVTDPNGTRMHVYDYDSIYQLTGVDYPTGFDPNLGTDTTFSYDAAGNRSSVIKPALSEAERGSGTCTYTTNNLNQYTAAGSASYQYDASGNMTHDPNFLYTYDPENRLIKARKSGQSAPPGSALAEAVDSGLSYTTGGDTNWQPTNWPYHYGGDSAEGTAWNNGNSWMQTEVQGAGTITFWWKVSSESGGDYLEFYIDDIRLTKRTP
jgi:YD repeat-containing protein